MYKTTVASIATSTLVFATSLIAQPSPSAEQVRALSLLASSPLVEPTQSVVRQAQFVRDVRDLLARVPGDVRPDVASARDATTALQRLVADLRVTASVKSVPKSLVVWYRQVVDEGQIERTVTTDDELLLPPALYRFRGLHPQSGETIIRTVSCATNCRIIFDFSEKSDLPR